MDDEKDLIQAFIGYRELLTPIESNLKLFAQSFESIKEDIKSLNTSFNQTKLEKIYGDLAYQAEKSKNLAGMIEKFSAQTEEYVDKVDKISSLLTSLENKILTANKIEERAQEQIEKLDKIIEEKKKSYDINSLEKSLVAYGLEVQKINDYINKEVAENIKNNSEQVALLTKKNADILKVLAEEHEDIRSLMTTYSQTNELMRKIIEKKDVNEEYIFELFDKFLQQKQK